ncbi:MAG TPA: lysophospholipid acyltransferase family protein [Gemmatimonadaceae bacterium]
MNRDPQSVPRLDIGRWYYRYGYVGAARLLSAYHRTRVRRYDASVPPDGPCIYVAHHGAGYFTLDLVVACYQLGWRAWHERRGRAAPTRIVASRDHTMERVVPGLRAAKRHVGIIDPSEDACLAVLERGEQLLITPGGRREARPEARGYRLRWRDRFGFARLALLTGAPIIPLAVVGGFEAYPGWSRRKSSFWFPVPLPVRFDVRIGAPIGVSRSQDDADDIDAVRRLHERAWRATQALYDEIIAERRGEAALARLRA